MEGSLTVVVLALNEEINLRECLCSVNRLTKDVFVLDSGSSDQTVAIAASLGVPVYENAFTGFGDQRNWAIDNIPHKNEWVLHIDADERLTDAFIAEVNDLIATKPDEAGFFVSSKLMLGNHWLRYSSGFPVYQVRLFHLERLRFENHGHGQREVTSGRIGYLHEPYLHYAFSKGLQHWFERHTRYALEEAQRSRPEPIKFFSDIWQCVKGSRTNRRRALKRLTAKLPARATLRFLELLILRRGILDGRAGITYAKMMGAYETMYSTYLSAMKNKIEL